MVSKRFLRGTRDVLARNDGRRDYLQYRGERCLVSLSRAGRGVLSLPGVPGDRKDDYLDALDAINDHYFEARAFERDARGKFYRYDEESERALRSAVAEELSSCVENLRRFLSAHDAVLDSPEMVGDGNVQVSRPREQSTKVSRHTSRAVREGWYPVVASYDHALDPGERVAEGKKRHRQRLYGQQSIPGVAQLLDTPLFERLSGEDLARIRELDRFGAASGRRIATRLTERHDWLLAD